MTGNCSVVIFDGVCTLCNCWVKLILKNDKTGKFCFTPLQSESAKKLLSKFENEKISDSVLLIENGVLFQQSTAALRIARKLSLYRAVYVFIIIPKPIRDMVYKWIARKRYKWFGKMDTCMIPDHKWKSRFV